MFKKITLPFSLPVLIISSAPDDRSANPENGITMIDEPDGNGMKYFIEEGVTNVRGSSFLDQRQCKPFTHHGQMAFPEKLQRYRGHVFYIGCYFFGVIVCT